MRHLFTEKEVLSTDKYYSQLAKTLQKLSTACTDTKSSSVLSTGDSRLVPLKEKSLRLSTRSTEISVTFLMLSRLG